MNYPSVTKGYGSSRIIRGQSILIGHWEKETNNDNIIEAEITASFTEIIKPIVDAHDNSLTKKITNTPKSTSSPPAITTPIKVENKIPQKEPEVNSNVKMVDFKDDNTWLFLHIDGWDYESSELNHKSNVEVGDYPELEADVFHVDYRFVSCVPASFLRKLRGAMFRSFVVPVRKRRWVNEFDYLQDHQSSTSTCLSTETDEKKSRRLHFLSRHKESRRRRQRLNSVNFQQHELCQTVEYSTGEEVQVYKPLTRKESNLVSLTQNDSVVKNIKKDRSRRHPRQKARSVYLHSDVATKVIQRLTQFRSRGTSKNRRHALSTSSVSVVSYKRSDVDPNETYILLDDDEQKNSDFIRQPYDDLSCLENCEQKGMECSISDKKLKQKLPPLFVPQSPRHAGMCPLGHHEIVQPFFPCRQY